MSSSKKFSKGEYIVMGEWGSSQNIFANSAMWLNKKPTNAIGPQCPPFSTRWSHDENVTIYIKLRKKYFHDVQILT